MVPTVYASEDWRRERCVRQQARVIEFLLLLGLRMLVMPRIDYNTLHDKTMQASFWSSVDLKIK